MKKCFALLGKFKICLAAFKIEGYFFTAFLIRFLNVKVSLSLEAATIPEYVLG